MTQTIGEQLDTQTPLTAPTVPVAFQRVVARYPDRPALRTVDDSVRLTWSQLNDRVRRTAAGLSALGVGPGDTVAILLPNTVDSHVIDYAATHLGAVPFAIFNSAPAEQIEHQLRAADATLVVTQQGFAAKVAQAVGALGDQVRHVVLVDGQPGGDTRTLAEVDALGDPDFEFDSVWASIGADDIATLIYTSGTTGAPKAAQWSHRTILSQQRALDAVLPLPHDNVVSFLPLAHAGGRITVHYMALAYGAAITVCPDPRELPATLAQVRPDAFFSVPRFWEKIQVAIETAIARQPGEQREILEGVVAEGLRRTRAADSGSAGTDDHTQTPAQDSPDPLRPILATLGLDRIKAAFVGGAPSAPELSQFFRAVGIPMLEAYGLTEGSLNVFNLVERFKSGTAGLPLPGVEIRLADDGELLARSDLNFVGYRHLPEATAQALDADGWLHTGDIAEIDDDGFITIVDRKKELIINSAGKNMSPATIESAVKGETSLIGQVVAIGDRRNYVTALITPDADALAEYARRLGIDPQNIAAVVDSAEVRADIDSAVERGNRRLNNNEQIKKYTVLPVIWLPDSDELTPTAKVKRRVINTKYAEEIEDLYQ